MIISIPLNTTIARMLKKMQEQQMKNRDRRTRLMSELLANIKRCVSLVHAEISLTIAIRAVSNSMHGNMHSSAAFCMCAMIWS